MSLPAAYSPLRVGVTTDGACCPYIPIFLLGHALSTKVDGVSNVDDGSIHVSKECINAMIVIVALTNGIR